MTATCSLSRSAAAVEVAVADGFGDMNNGFGWNRLPKSFMGENTVFLLLTAIIRNFYKFIMARFDVKRFGLKATSRIKVFVFKFISVPAKWVRTSRQYVLNHYCPVKTGN